MMVRGVGLENGGMNSMGFNSSRITRFPERRNPCFGCLCVSRSLSVLNTACGSAGGSVFVSSGLSASSAVLTAMGDRAFSNLAIFSRMYLLMYQQLSLS